MKVLDTDLNNRYFILKDVTPDDLTTVKFVSDGTVAFTIQILDEAGKPIETLVKHTNGVATTYRYTVRSKKSGQLALKVITPSHSTPKAWTFLEVTYE